MTVVSTPYTAVPDAGARARTPEAATREVLRVWEIGADEADLHLRGGPKAAANVSIWRTISRGFSLLWKNKV